MFCPVCHASMDTTASRCAVPGAGTYPWYSCPICRHGFLAVPEQINNEFQANYHKHTSRLNELVNNHIAIPEYLANRRQLRNSRYALICNHIKLDSSILEVGCGGGYMLEAFASTNKILGIEIDPLCVEVCRHLSVPCLQGDFFSLYDSGKLDKHYDVVMLWHVLEHFVDIHGAIRRVSNLTKGGGLLCLEVSVGRRRCKKYNGCPHNFSEMSIRRLIAANTEIASVLFQTGLQKSALLALVEVR